MRVGIVKYNFREPLDAMASGIRLFGDTPVVQHLNDSFPESMFPDDYDAVMVWGWGGSVKRVADIYARRGIKTIVVEQGHIRRGEYYQVGFGLNWLPDYTPIDRLEAVAGSLIQPWQPIPDGYVLLCPQMPGDAQHNIQDMGVWTRDALARIREHTGRKVVLRRHPNDSSPAGDMSAFDAVEEKGKPLAESLTGAWCVATHNSNTGIQAMLAGKPVLCDAGCWYASAAETDWSRVEELKHDDRAGLLARVAYAQWTIKEMEQGKAWEYLRKHILEVRRCAAYR